MNKRCRKFLINILSLAIIILLFIVFVNAVKGDETCFKEYKKVSYTVSAGDTLWSIAGENISSEQDKRLYIDNIKRINKLDSTNLRIGQELIILKKN